MIAKPELTKCHERAMELLFFMEATNGNFTKQYICENVFKWVYNKSNERRTREVISYLATLHPIISVSNSSGGYRLAKHDNDADDVEHALRELQSRIDELKKRMTPLHKLRKKKHWNGVLR